MAEAELTCWYDEAGQGTGADTTLVINDPQGNWYCKDNTNGLHPEIAFSSSQAGQYDVWVGLIGNAGDYPAARLTIIQN